MGKIIIERERELLIDGKVGSHVSEGALESKITRWAQHGSKLQSMKRLH